MNYFYIVDHNGILLKLATYPENLGDEESPMAMGEKEVKNAKIPNENNHLVFSFSAYTSFCCTFYCLSLFN